MEPNFTPERPPTRTRSADAGERSLELAQPRFGPPLFLALLSFGLALAAGLLTIAAILGRLPGWLDPAHVVPLRSLGVEILAGLIGLMNFAGASLATAAFAGRSWRLLRHRLGGAPAEEIEGPSLLVEEAPGIWSFRVRRFPCESRRDLDPPESNASGAATQPSRSCSDPPEIAFYLDEGTAACISRTFHPWEVVRLRCLDLPRSSGGPALLHVRELRRQAAFEESSASIAA